MPGTVLPTPTAMILFSHSYFAAPVSKIGVVRQVLFAAFRREEQTAIGHVDQLLVVGPERDPHVELADAVGTHEDPVGAAASAVPFNFGPSNVPPVTGTMRRVPRFWGAATSRIMSIRNSVFSGAGADAAAGACWLLAAAVSAAASVVTAPSAAVCELST